MSAFRFGQSRRIGVLAGPLAALAVFASFSAARAQDKAPARSDKHDCNCPPFFRNLPTLGAESPRALGQRFYTSLVDGNKNQMLSCFDLNSIESLTTAVFFAELAEVWGLSTKLDRDIRERFGPAGMDVLNSVLEFTPNAKQANMPKDELEKSLSKIVVDREKGVAVLPGELGGEGGLQMRLENSRWYIKPLEGETADSSTVISLSIVGALHQMKRVQQILQKSQSLDQFKKELNALKAKTIAEQKQPASSKKP